MPDLEHRLRAKLRPEGDCLIWTGGTNGGVHDAAEAAAAEAAYLRQKIYGEFAGKG